MTSRAEFDPHQVPIRDAATVMLVRDSAGGVEVFMLRRTLRAAFASGMYVFPGGAVDDADRSSDVGAWCDGLRDGEASAILRVPSGGLGYWIAAIRECFEEAGVLLARRPDGEFVRFDAADEDRFVEHRRAVHAGTRRLIDVCATEGLRLATDRIRYVSHWITPVGEVRRFDTRFFVAPAPEAQEPLHDDHETIESLWVRAADALARSEAGDLAMIPPTLKNLEFLAEHDTATAVMEAASSIGTPPLIQPRLRIDGDGKVVGVVLPGEVGFDELV